jgi:uncharacterized protein involved in exopolysaccharide biosynthesis
MTRLRPNGTHMPHQHHERPSSALAHGAATATDIERVRQQITAVEQRETDLAARYGQRVTQRVAEQRARGTQRRGTTPS